MSDLVIKWTKEDIAQRKPEWDDAKCFKFLEFVKKDLIAAAESAGNGVIDRVLGGPG